MTDISAISGFENLTIDSKTKEAPKSNELGKDAFLELMLAQMENQDPLSPKENSAMVAELAQFSQVENLDQLANSFEELSNNLMSGQTLQATSLVGRAVTVPGDTASLGLNNVVSGSVELPASTTDMTLNIYSDAGSLVESVPLGFQPKGDMLFRWDGYNMEVNGELIDWQSSHEEGLPAGTYTFEASANLGGDMTQLDMALSHNVNSVTLEDSGDLTLNLAGVGPVSMAQIKQFN
ncbi:MAG: flagellar hook assembly protein FlgD [Candidatus Pelagadaptatus aseana]|uniref:flagellar hook assembly protein FlgD n=1 Tax=Candidatus Pelagadaptatus aseana TaxID=3120508 RepID=UPI0039B245DF